MRTEARMFDASHAGYLVRNRIEERLHECSMWIIGRVPLQGILEATAEDLAGHGVFPAELIEETIAAMRKSEPPVMTGRRGRLVFDYAEKDIEYVRHFRNALSNAQGFFDPEAFQ
jgi:hypothetical protein